MIQLNEYFKNKTHVIWDWNGTLLSDIHHAVDTVNRLLADHGLEATTIERYKQEFGFPVIEYYKKLGFDPCPDKFRILSERFNQLFHDGLDRCDLWPGAREILGQVKASGRTQSLLSASEHNTLVATVRRFEIDHLFDHVMGIADKLAAGKIEFGRRLMHKAGVPPEECVLVGDTDHDLEVAQALGIEMVLVDHGHQCPTRLRRVHHRVVRVI